MTTGTTMNCNDNLETVYQGDDTGAFGQHFLHVDARIPEGFEVSKVDILITGLEPITVENPVFPFDVNLDSEQTSMLAQYNEIKMVAFDMQGRPQTCEGGICFGAKTRVN